MGECYLSKRAYGGNYTGIQSLTPIMTSANTPSPYVVTWSSEYSNSQWPDSSQGWNIFNGKHSDNLGLVTIGAVWASKSRTYDGSGNPLNGVGEWVQIDLGEASKINIFSYINGFNNGMVENFQLLGSNDLINWDIVLSKTGISRSEPAYSVPTPKWFYVNSAKEYRYYKFLATKISDSGGIVQIGEVSMLKLI